jgi:hypothetical protein
VGHQAGLHDPPTRLLTSLEHVLGITGGTTGLADGPFDNRDDGVVGDTSFAGTVVVHDIAEARRSLLHSVTPDRTSRFRFSQAPPGSRPGRSLIGRIRFGVGFDPYAEGLAIVQVGAG